MDMIKFMYLIVSVQPSPETVYLEELGEAVSGHDVGGRAHEPDDAT